jgi:hypothetical protein
MMNDFENQTQKVQKKVKKTSAKPKTTENLLAVTVT